MTTVPHHASTSRSNRQEVRRVLAGTVVGTSIEWYDFFIYATTGALVFGDLFFTPLASDNPALTQIIAFASIGISFFFRPLGAIIAGDLGDRLGRKKMLVLTLLLMGGSTATIGLLPTYGEIGLWAPLVLMALRILQGLSAGGEWGGAALMAVEHAPKGRRGISGAFPQIGVPIGMFMASVVLSVVILSLGVDTFVAWGWRIPFLLSVAMIVIGYIIRRTLDESPVFEELRARKRQSSAPLKVLLKHNTPDILRAALVFIGNNAAGWILIAYIPSYAVNALGMTRYEVLAMTAVAATAWIATTLWSGVNSDRIGRRRTFQIGYAALFVWMVPAFLLIETRNVLMLGLAAVVLAFGLGFTYGPLPALYAEMFPAAVRYSGVSIAYALGAIIGGAFAPMVAEILIDTTGWSPSIGIYVMVLSAISFVAVRAVKDGREVDLVEDPEPARATAA